MNIDKIYEAASEVNGLPELTWIDVDPELAHALLAQNTKNRHMRPSYVELLKGAMKRGEWRPAATEPIRVTKNGRLDNGQHRLQALIEADKTLAFPFVLGTASSGADQEAEGIGRSRTVADALRIRGEINAALLAGSLRYAWAYDTHGKMDGYSRQRVTHAQLLRYLGRHGEIRDSIPATKDARDLRGAVSGYVALHYLFSRSDEDEATEFFARLGTGEELQAGDPILALRRAILKITSARTGRQDATRMCAWVIKAWNLWQLGEEAQNIYWRGRKEGFPQIADVAPENPAAGQ